MRNKSLGRRQPFQAQRIAAQALLLGKPAKVAAAAASFYARQDLWGMRREIEDHKKRVRRMQVSHDKNIQDSDNDDEIYEVPYSLV